ncbi:cytochrome b/b6 domain-containing protein [Ghiorsea bivora]|uniref:cytochrome b/b6 domain-containing protein n=1 Tax=Ghiorsea bivora TaxID=1485545 RepID=UPI000571AA8F|nr:cytochrome b/b6 domain-containing protein [Ghiorsea bivora]
MNVVKYPWILRIFHAVFAACLLAQLAVGELMDVPEVEGEHQEAMHILTQAFAHENEHLAEVGVTTPSLGFETHEFLGLTIVGLLVFRMILALMALPEAGWRTLFPWLQAEGRTQLLQELNTQIKGWFRLELANPQDSETTAKTMHGILLMLAAIMAVTGVLLYFGWSITAPQSWMVVLVAEVHEAIVGVLEAMIALHVLAAILHERQGHGVLARISPKP